MILEKLDASPDTIDFVIEKLRRLPWSQSYHPIAPSDTPDAGAAGEAAEGAGEGGEGEGEGEGNGEGEGEGGGGEGGGGEGEGEGEGEGGGEGEGEGNAEAVAAKQAEEAKRVEEAKQAEVAARQRAVDVEALVLACVMKVRKLSWAGIGAVADVLAGLFPYHERLVRGGGGKG